MLTIRREQMAALGERRSKDFERFMLRHLRECFPRALDALGDGDALVLIHDTLERARRYDLRSEADGCRFLNLAASFGWDFELRPERAWMLAMLRDPDVSSPSQRLRILVDECVHRARIESHNRSLRAAFGVSGP